MTMFTQYGPPREEGWARATRERYGDACIDQPRRAFAPNVQGAVLEREVLAPPDLERIFGLVGGSIFQGEQGLDQMAFMRPTPELAQYATPVDGLYLCGAGTHPGGGVMAARATTPPSASFVTAAARACPGAAEPPAETRSAALVDERGALAGASLRQGIRSPARRCSASRA